MKPRGFVCPPNRGPVPPQNTHTGAIVAERANLWVCRPDYNEGSCFLAGLDIFLCPSGFKWLLRHCLCALDSEGPRLLGKQRRRGETAVS